VKQYRDPKKRRGKDTLVEVCNKVAWTAVKSGYKKSWLRRKWVKR